MADVALRNGTIQIVVLAHNEEARIDACLDSLPVGEPGIALSVVVNGSTDRTAEIVKARSDSGVELVEYAEGGKARSWNRFVLDQAPKADVFVFVDGDAALLPGSVYRLAEAIRAAPGVNAAAGVPANGRTAWLYRRSILRGKGLFGDCYALSGDFVQRLRASGIRLPDDLVGDDGLIRALACTDLGPDSEWRSERVVPCRNAGFLCEPNRLTLQGLRQQSARMVNYSLRHFQNLIVRDVMRGVGPTGLPSMLAQLYPAYLPRFRARLSPVWYWSDRQALALMQARVPVGVPADQASGAASSTRHAPPAAR